jgi:hypothetical protein
MFNVGDLVQHKIDFSLGIIESLETVKGRIRAYVYWFEHEDIYPYYTSSLLKVS